MGEFGTLLGVSPISERFPRAHISLVMKKRKWKAVFFRTTVVLVTLLTFVPISSLGKEDCQYANNKPGCLCVATRKICERTHILDFVITLLESNNSTLDANLMLKVQRIIVSGSIWNLFAQVSLLKLHELQSASAVSAFWKTLKCKLIPKWMKKLYGYYLLVI